MEALFAGDLAVLQDLYNEVNGLDPPQDGRVPGVRARIRRRPPAGGVQAIPWIACTQEMAYIAYHFHWSRGRAYMTPDHTPSAAAGCARSPRSTRTLDERVMIDARAALPAAALSALAPAPRCAAVRRPSPCAWHWSDGRDRAGRAPGWVLDDVAPRVRSSVAADPGGPSTIVAGRRRRPAASASGSGARERRSPHAERRLSTRRPSRAVARARSCGAPRLRPGAAPSVSAGVPCRRACSSRRTTSSSRDHSRRPTPRRAPRGAVAAGGAEPRRARRPPPLDVARLTDHVLASIDRRSSAERERRGRALMPALEKATITDTVTGERVTVLFNPEEYTVKRESNSPQIAVPGSRRPSSSSSTATADPGDGAAPRHLREHRQAGNAARRRCPRPDAAVADLMDIAPTTHAPPVLLFAWGSLTFTCVLSRCVQRSSCSARRDAGPRAPAGHLQRVPQRRPRGQGDQARDGRLHQAARRQRGRDAADDRCPAYGDPRAVAADRRRATPSTTRASSRSARRSRVPRLPLRDPDSGEVYAMSRQPRYAPESRLSSAGGRCRPIAGSLTGLLAAVGRLEGVDRLELTLANERPALARPPAVEASTPTSSVSVGYTPDAAAAGCSTARSSATRRDVPRRSRCRR